jgi:hypothetical protein
MVLVICRKTLRQGVDGFSSPSKEGVMRIFVALKNLSPSAGFEPANLGSSWKHANHYTTEDENIHTHTHRFYSVLDNACIIWITEKNKYRGKLMLWLNQHVNTSKYGAVFLKLWSAHHRWSDAVRQVVRRRLQKRMHCKHCIIHVMNEKHAQYMSVLRLPLLVDITFCPTIIILVNGFKTSV